MAAERYVARRLIACTRKITEVLERIAYLTEPGIDRSLGEINNVLVRRYAWRLAARSPPVNA